MSCELNCNECKICQRRKNSEEWGKVVSHFSASYYFNLFFLLILGKDQAFRLMLELEFSSFFRNPGDERGGSERERKSMGVKY